MRMITFFMPVVKFVVKFFLKKTGRCFFGLEDEEEDEEEERLCGRTSRKMFWSFEVIIPSSQCAMQIQVERWNVEIKIQP